MLLHRNILEVIPSEKPESSTPSLTENDGYLLDSERVGNFEWWYFDCIDNQNECMLKIVVHLGTDPLRRSFFPTLALSIRTPETTRAIETRYSLNDFSADKYRCDIELGGDCHIYSEGDHPGNYKVDIDMSGFRASLIFKHSVPTWAPPVNKIRALKGRRESEFFWNVPQPRSAVDGYFEYNNTSYTVSDAIGYHDHNYWQLNSKQGLFIEEVITGWCWGKCVAGTYTVIFSKIWMGRLSAGSIMVMEHEKIVYDTDKDLTITVNEEKTYAPLKSRYPSRITIKINSADFPLELALNCEELVESKDLLKGVNPFFACLIKSIVARPAYYGINSRARLGVQNMKLTGSGNYEIMLFR